MHVQRTVGVLLVMLVAQVALEGSVSPRPVVATQDDALAERLRKKADAVGKTGDIGTALELMASALDTATPKNVRVRVAYAMLFAKVRHTHIVSMYTRVRLRCQAGSGGG